jgi:hypothetical protein
MEKKEIKKKNHNQKGSEKKDEEDLIETLGEEVHLHLDEERQEKEKEIGELTRRRRSRSITTVCSDSQPILRIIRRGRPETRKIGPSSPMRICSGRFSLLSIIWRGQSITLKRSQIPGS